MGVNKNTHKTSCSSFKIQVSQIEIHVILIRLSYEMLQHNIIFPSQSGHLRTCMDSNETRTIFITQLKSFS